MNLKVKGSLEVSLEESEIKTGLSRGVTWASISWWLWNSKRGKSGWRGKKMNVYSFFSLLEWLELWFHFSKGDPASKSFYTWQPEWTHVSQWITFRCSPPPQRLKYWSVIADKCHTAALDRSLRHLTNLNVVKWDYIAQGSVYLRSGEINWIESPFMWTFMQALISVVYCWARLCF